MTENKTYNDSPTFIPSRLESSVHSSIPGNGNKGPVADAKDIYDINHDKWQKDINDEIETVPAEIERIDGELGNRYTKEETYNKTEVDTKESGLQGQINTIKGGSTKSIATIDNEINGSNGIDERLQTVEALGEITVGGGDIQIATGADFDDPDASQKAKAVTVGAVLGGIINTPVFDLTVYTGDTYTDLEAALAVMGNVNFPAQLKKGGMIIKFETNDNKYLQYRLMSDTFSTTESDWQGVDKELIEGSKNLVESGVVYKAIEDATDKLYQYSGRRKYVVNVEQAKNRIIYLDIKANINYYITCSIPSAVENMLYFIIYDRYGNVKSTGSGWYIEIGETSFSRQFSINENLIGGYIGLYCSSPISDVDITIVSDEGNSMSNVKSWILNDAFIPSTVTRDSEGNVTSATGTWPDGITGTLTLTRDASGFVTQVNALRTNIGRIYLNITRDSDGNVTSASFA